MLKALHDRELGALPSDTVKNSKLNINSISTVSSRSSCPQFYSVNAISTCFKQTQVLQKEQDDKTYTNMSVNQVIKTPPKQNLDDEFKELYLECPVIDILTRAPCYNALLEKYEKL